MDSNQECGEGKIYIKDDLCKMFFYDQKNSSGSGSEIFFKKVSLWT